MRNDLSKFHTTAFNNKELIQILKCYMIKSTWYSKRRNILMCVMSSFLFVPTIDKQLYSVDLWILLCHNAYISIFLFLVILLLLLSLLLLLLLLLLLVVVVVVLTYRPKLYGKNCTNCNSVELRRAYKAGKHRKIVLNFLFLQHFSVISTKVISTALSPWTPSGGYQQERH
jgi:hypothetical protein